MPAAPGLIVINYTPRPLKPAGATRIYLYQYGPTIVATTPRQFPNPGNWNPANNEVECVGPGGGGSVSPMADINNAAGSGGGGAAYAFATNLSPTFPVNFNCQGSLGSDQQNQYDQQNATWWNNYTQNTGNVVARFGTPGSSFSAQSSNSTPGAGGNLAYPAGFNGGSGGAGVQNTSNGTGAGGGGGAGGPHGAGVSAANVSSGNVSSSGATSDGGQTAGSSGAGISGTQWDHLHGIGGGSAGGATLTAGFTAGNFGAGGGGALGSAAYYTGNGNFGPGTGGLIVLTYTPLPPPPPQGQAQIMA